MTVGVDFDNTIVCYDQVFHSVALRQGLIPKDLPISKTKVRDYLRQCGKEDAWTEMQGLIYGDRMEEAQPFPGALDFFIACKERKIPVVIISHKTLHPYRGAKYNLHESAQKWLEKQGFYDAKSIGLDKSKVSFVLTKQEKLSRIGEMNCTHFIDDLPEFLLEETFPKNVSRILFDPTRIHPEDPNLQKMNSWPEIAQLIFQDDKGR